MSAKSLNDGQTGKKSAHYVLSLFFATATVLIAKLFISKVSNASKNADNYNSHEKLFHLYLQ